MAQDGGWETSAAALHRPASRPVERRPARQGRTHAAGAARFAAGLASFYALGLTAALLPLTGFFASEPSPRTLMAWLLVPVLASFGSWMAANSAFTPLRACVWFAVLTALFFCWIAIFSVGVYYLPVPLLLLVAVLSPWDGREQGDDALSGE